MEFFTKAQPYPTPHPLLVGATRIFPGLFPIYEPILAFVMKHVRVCYSMVSLITRRYSPRSAQCSNQQFKRLLLFRQENPTRIVVIHWDLFIAAMPTNPILQWAFIPLHFLPLHDVNPSLSSLAGKNPSEILQSCGSSCKNWQLLQDLWIILGGMISNRWFLWFVKDPYGSCIESKRVLQVSRSR